MSRPVELWFFGWLGRHKALNRSAGWRVFEAEGDDVYGTWADDFDRLGVAESEAGDASRAMSREPSRMPEEHLGRLKSLIVGARAERDRVAAKAERDSLDARHDRDVAELADARAAWARLPEAERSARVRSVLDRFPGLAGVRRLVERWAIDEWRGVELPDPAAFAPPARAAPEAAPIPAPPSAGPPALDPGRERELIAQAEAKRRSDLSRLHAIQRAKTTAR